MADETGPMKAVWFNQPWLADQLTPGSTRAAARAAARRGNKFRVDRVRARARRRRRVHTAGLVPVYPATEGLPPRADPRARLVACASIVHDVIEPLPGLPARRRAPARPAGRARGGALPGGARATTPRRAGGWPSRSCSCSSWRCRRGAARAARAGRRAPLEASRRAGRSAGSRRCRSSSPATSSAAFERDRRATWRATRPMQRLLMGEVGLGQDRRGAARDAARRRERLARRR